MKSSSLTSFNISQNVNFLESTRKALGSYEPLGSCEPLRSPEQDGSCPAFSTHVFTKNHQIAGL